VIDDQQVFEGDVVGPIVGSALCFYGIYVGDVLAIEHQIGDLHIGATLYAYRIAAGIAIEYGRSPRLRPADDDGGIFRTHYVVQIHAVVIISGFQQQAVARLLKYKCREAQETLGTA